jgi:hypothetical protein
MVQEVASAVLLFIAIALVVAGVGVLLGIGAALICSGFGVALWTWLVFSEVEDAEVVTDESA